MMIHIKIYTRLRDLNSTNFEEIWKLLDLPVFQAGKYDFTEPLKLNYDITDSANGYQILKKGLIVKGLKNNYLTASHKPTGITHWKFTLDIEDEEQQIIDLIKKFNYALPILFGLACTKDEYDKKHKVARRSSYGWKGASMWNFQEFLPGVYWLNIYGKKLAEALDINKIKSLEKVTLFEMDHGTVMFHLDEPITPENMEHRIGKERKIADVLGRTYFFDVEYRDEIEFSHPQDIKEYIKSLASDY